MMSLDLNDWWPWYERVSKDFGLGRMRDQRVAELLSLLLRNKAMFPRDLKGMIEGYPVVVLGAGPSLEKDLQKVKHTDVLNKFVILAADGATSGLMDICLRYPNVIVTDLDGKMPDLISANSKGSVMVVHAHAENGQKIVDYVPRFPKIKTFKSIDNGFAKSIPIKEVNIISKTTLGFEDSIYALRNFCMSA